MEQLKQRKQQLKPVDLWNVNGAADLSDLDKW